MVDIPKTPRRRASDRLLLPPIVWAFIVLTVIFFGTLAGFGWVVSNVSDNSKQLATLISENEKRIAEIQQARIESCEKTYEGIRDVFKPFFPPEPRTPEQISDLERFNTIINRLQQGCEQQTGQG